MAIVPVCWTAIEKAAATCSTARMVGITFDIVMHISDIYTMHPFVKYFPLPARSEFGIGAAWAKFVCLFLGN